MNKKSEAQDSYIKRMHKRWELETGMSQPMSMDVIADWHAFGSWSQKNTGKPWAEHELIRVILYIKKTYSPEMRLPSMKISKLIRRPEEFSELLALANAERIKNKRPTNRERVLAQSGRKVDNPGPPAKTIKVAFDESKFMQRGHALAEAMRKAIKEEEEKQ